VLVDNGRCTDEELNGLQWASLEYYIRELNYRNGLIADKTQPGSPASIAAVGMAMATLPILAAREHLPRRLLAKRLLSRLRFLWESPHGPEPDASGHRGFYYHYLDMETGKRAGKCELSTVDTAFLMAGVLAAATYFDRDTEDESEVRRLAESLYQRVDWQWALNGGATLTHGWTPENGFLPYRWQGYDESLLLYILALGSPTHPVPKESYAAWASTYRWREVYGYEYLYAGPLFIHQMSHLWIDFRGIQDAFMRERKIDYFENSRRATYVHQQYGIRNPHQFEGYGERCWGITASDGPGFVVRTIKGVERQFFDYIARGVPDGPDDGTLAPWAVVASLPFAPEIVLPTIKRFDEMDLGMIEPYGFKATFNPTFSVEGSDHGWVSPWHIGVDQGPIIIAIENYRTGMLWQLMQRCPYIVDGLRRAGFTNGWLS
jgi:hypothetical protein